MPEHKFLFLDFETFYSKEYSLRKMPTPAYILDPRYETIMCAVKVNNEPSYVVDGPDFAAFLKQFDPANTTTITFNALFDNSILAWRYGFVPATLLDAMGMARALHGHELQRFSLDSVAKHLGIGEKLGTLVKVEGMTRAQIIAAGLWSEFCSYAKQDVDLTYGIFKKLLPNFPHSERKLMDLVLRCTVEPQFHIDRNLLNQHLAEVKQNKANLLSKTGVTVDQLMSSDMFVAELKKLGVEPEYKTSPTGRSIPALAKTDEFMNDLLEHEDAAVQALVAARIGHKTTLEETRSETLLTIDALPWAQYRHGNGASMPIPLRYGGAHTHRLSGEWKMNMQNLPRGGNLRRALIAPPGYRVVVCDLGQIEARLVAWLCGQVDLMEAFRNNKDPYSLLASDIFQRAINRKLPTDKVEGFIGKTGILGLGYACGDDKFYNMVLKDSRKLGIDVSHMWTPELAQKAVNTYRRKNKNIRAGWYALDSLVQTAWLGKMGPAKFGPVTISHGRVELPSGLALLYNAPAARFVGEHFEYFYQYGRKHHKLYGAKLLENISQALARIIVMNAALRLRDRGYRFILQAHDELVFMVPAHDVDNAKQIIHTEFVRPPSWGTLNGHVIPLSAEVSDAASYGEAK